MKNLKVAYSHNSASSMFVNLNILSFGELLRKKVYNFRNRLETRDNVMIYLVKFQPMCLISSKIPTDVSYICFKNYAKLHIQANSLPQIRLNV